MNKKRTCILVISIIAMGLLPAGCRAVPAVPSARPTQTTASDTAAPLPDESSAPPPHTAHGIVQAWDGARLTVRCAGETLVVRVDAATVRTGEAEIEQGQEAQLMYDTDAEGELHAASLTLSPDPNLIRAKELLAAMTPEEKVGQLFLARFPAQDAAACAAQYALGGYILFARDFEHETPGRILSKINEVQQAQKLGMLIGVDEEGGTVNRVSRFAQFRQTPFASPQAVYAAGGFDGIAADAAEKCAFLSALGINLNFAPVCDVSTSRADFMYPRAFGLPAEETAAYVRAVVRENERCGMTSVLKHFPGYGDTADTHTGIARDSRPYETFENSDMLPFRAGVAEGADMVLVAHTIVESMDETRPASISPEVHAVLRAELGERVVVITDDLVMQGLRDFIGDGDAAVAAVEAGNDLLCSSDFETQVPAVLRALRDGTLTEARIDRSVLRILRLKLEKGILQ